jgi:hypothetical protein
MGEPVLRLPAGPGRGRHDQRRRDALCGGSASRRATLDDRGTAVSMTCVKTQFVKLPNLTQPSRRDRAARRPVGLLLFAAYDRVGGYLFEQCVQVITELPLANMALSDGRAMLDIDNIHIKADACGGDVTIRSYAYLRISTGAAHSSFAIYGDPAKI